MKLKANDTMFISSVKSDNILPGEEFEVSDDAGKDYVARGLATRIGVAPAPENKMIAAPMGKASFKGKGK